ncbi:MAG TPA: MJ0042-type zinc finger domain-containing protein [Thermoanaerobaculia bacterium]|nr:MJ0042-type zinc finger domain-containing protein [Thermoanaerobaculia bacterium]
MNDSEPRYTFACPSCAGSFSISLDKIPPVQARFSCPKCGKAMDFPSRDEARVYISLKSSGGIATAAAPAPEPVRPVPPPPPPPAPKPVSPRPPVPAAPVAETAFGDTTATSLKSYRVEKKGYESDVFDRRAMRTLIRTQLVNEGDLVAVDGAEAARADTIAELKSLFELRKSARAVPPPVCPTHMDRLAHYKCGDTGRPLCEECADEKKFGGASVRVCAHCGGTAAELHESPGDIT